MRIIALQKLHFSFSWRRHYWVGNVMLVSAMHQNFATKILLTLPCFTSNCDSSLACQNKTWQAAAQMAFAKAETVLIEQQDLPVLTKTSRWPDLENTQKIQILHLH